MKMTRKSTRLIKIIFLILCVITLFSVCIPNIILISQTRHSIFRPGALERLPAADCILILGARVWDSGIMSIPLSDRVKMGLEVYQAGKAKIILISGDAKSQETQKMFATLTDAEVPKEDIFVDGLGLSTYESVYRARYVFGCKTLIIVTQTYHQYRALYMAHSLGMTAYGQACDKQRYYLQIRDEVREVLARVKGFVTTMRHPSYPIDTTYDITRSGVVTQNASNIE